MPLTRPEQPPRRTRAWGVLLPGVAVVLVWYGAGLASGLEGSVLSLFEKQLFISLMVVFLFSLSLMPWISVPFFPWLILGGICPFSI